MSRRGMELEPTHSGRAVLVDVDPTAIQPGDVLVAPYGWGTLPSAVTVDRVRQGIHQDDGAPPKAVPVVDGTIERRGESVALVFAPEDLSRVAETWVPVAEEAA